MRDDKHRKRKQPVEPIFSIIEHAMKFPRLLLPGIDGVRGEWSPVMFACICRRLHALVLARRA